MPILTPRIPGERHAGILIHENQILLIHRKKNSYEYWVIPGGGREEGETGEQTVIREILEETGISVPKVDLLYQFQTDKGAGEPQTDFIYRGSDFPFQLPQLIGEEKDHNSAQDFYEPQWIDLPKAKTLNILPIHLKEYLVKNF